MGRLRIARPFVWLAAAVLLFWPVTPSTQGRVGSYLYDLLHFPLFAALTVTLLARDGRIFWPRRLLRTAVLILPLIILVELVQPWVGREREFRDLGLGLAGAATTAAFFAAARCPPGGRRGMFRGLGFAGVSAVLFPLVLIGIDRWEAARAFPVLAGFRSPLEIGRWTGYGCRLNRVRFPDGVRAMKVTVTGTVAYPGAFLVEAPRDWSRMRDLEVLVRWPEDQPREFWIRVDDRRGGPPYADRVQEAYVLTSGVNRLYLSRAQLGHTPAGRPFSLSHVVSLGLFFGQARPGDSVFVEEVRLLRPAAASAESEQR